MGVRRSRATRGRSNMQENTFTTSKFITKRLEVVLRVGFLKKTRSREMLTVREARKRTPRKTRKKHRIRVISKVPVFESLK